MGSPRSLEFVKNREAQGCFGADVQALSGIDQDKTHRALELAGLYHSFWGVSIASDLEYDAAMQIAGLPLRYEEVLPHYDPGSANRSYAKEPLDDSDEAVEHRLEVIREANKWDDHKGLLIAYPCQREEDRPHFLHFIAAIEPQESGAELTTMDPSELPGHGGVFHKTEEEVREILTPKPELGIPVCGYLVKMDVLPVPERVPALEAGAEPEAELSWEGMEAQLAKVPSLV